MTGPPSITPATLPSLPLDQRKDLPDTAALYFVLTGETVLYIGKSTNLRELTAEAR